MMAQVLRLTLEAASLPLHPPYAAWLDKVPEARPFKVEEAVAVLPVAAALFLRWELQEAGLFSLLHINWVKP